MLPELTMRPLVRAAETLRCRPVESFVRAFSQCATARSLRQSRNPARNIHCGNRVVAQHSAHKHPPLQTDLFAARNPLQRTSATLPASSPAGRPKNSPANYLRNVETVLLPVLTSVWV